MVEWRLGRRREWRGCRSETRANLLSDSPVALLSLEETAGGQWGVREGCGVRGWIGRRATRVRDLLLSCNLVGCGLDRRHVLTLQLYLAGRRNETALGTVQRLEMRSIHGSLFLRLKHLLFLPVESVPLCYLMEINVLIWRAKSLVNQVLSYAQRSVGAFYCYYSLLALQVRFGHVYVRSRYVCYLVNPAAGFADNPSDQRVGH